MIVIVERIEVMIVKLASIEAVILKLLYRQY